MYLSRFFLNPASRAVKFDLANPEGLHKTVMRMFPMGAGPQPRRELGVLHRLDESMDGRLTLFVQSKLAPDSVALPAGYLLAPENDGALAFVDRFENASTREVGSERQNIKAGARFVFRLKANATKKIGTKSTESNKKSNGTRVPVRGDEAKLDWLHRHAKASGFRVIDVGLRDVAPRGREIHVGGVMFDGRIAVVDAEGFREALSAGIGPAKAFGFGLLSIAPTGP